MLLRPEHLAVTVHCRVGSSEIADKVLFDWAVVHCRVGSSEMLNRMADAYAHVHCRVGSSEIILPDAQHPEHVHCRVGSSETLLQSVAPAVSCSLPSRQLRNLLWRCSDRRLQFTAE